MCVHVPAVDAAIAANDVQESGYEVLIEKIKKCSLEYISRRIRRTHPKGYFDSAKRFTLSNRHDCCTGIRTPSRSFPFSEMTHGRSLPHIAHEFGLEKHISIIRRATNRLEKDGMSAADDFLRSKPVKRKLIEGDLCS